MSHPGKSPNSTIYTHESHIDGRYGEKGKVYIVANDCAPFSIFGVEHEFILMNDSKFPLYKVYEWTTHNLKMYACGFVKFNEKKYLGIFPVSVVHKAALEASKGKQFSTLTYNCKDWVKAVEKILQKYNDNFNYNDYYKKIFKGNYNVNHFRPYLIRFLPIYENEKEYEYE